MNYLIWDDIKNLHWAELSEKLLKTKEKFSDIFLRTVELSPDANTKALITHDCMERFSGIIGIIAEIVNNGFYDEMIDSNGSIHNAHKLNGWILLGSVTETVLQFFIAFYLGDYQNTKWQLWDDFQDEKASPIFDVINNMVENKQIQSEQARSIKKAIKDTINKHTKEHRIEKVMLDELIQLYKKIDVMDQEELDYLQIIQSNRNGIHSFQHRDIGSWSEFQNGIKFFCYLMEWVLWRIPDISECYI